MDPLSEEDTQTSFKNCWEEYPQRRERERRRRVKMAWPRRERVVSFINNRWLVFVAAMWIQSCAGIGYLFGSISPVIKSSLNYNQKQLSRLGVAKDLGDSVGFLAGTLSEILPLWAALLVGAVQNLVGYGWVWLIVTGRAPILPLWAVSSSDPSF